MLLTRAKRMRILRMKKGIWLFTVYPSTKSYFPPLIPGLELTQMQNHGEQILMAVGVAVDNMYDLRTALSGLADLHAYSLRVEPTNFHFLIHCFQVMLASHLQSEYTAEMHAAWDKFLTNVAVVLTEKYH
ncbi:hemoglobin subunit mu isoform X2 [Antechinus flavipes]|uniref:hemoglobin subunit mu isoform X2 n=1 Tax=Antechinus flavipes TaxID=38775 RepID=UPI002235AF03|nr:hemoglobin subunit mu isoform X2 [Antechinus flavipes]